MKILNKLVCLFTGHKWEYAPYWLGEPDGSKRCVRCNKREVTPRRRVNRGEETPKLKIYRYDREKQCGLLVSCSCPDSFYINLDAWIAFNIVGCPRCGTEHCYSDYREVVKKVVGD